MDDSDYASIAANIIAEEEANFFGLLEICVEYVDGKEERSEKSEYNDWSAHRSRIREINCDEIIHETDYSCRVMTRMDKKAFHKLCGLLTTRGGLQPTRQVGVQEMVTRFLQIVSHDVKTRVVGLQFKRSGETVSRHFHAVLAALLYLDDVLLKKPEPVTSACTDTRWKWFENCLGALDGTYIEVNVPVPSQPRYRTRKGRLATNVLGVCSQHGEFIYVMAGWEGSAADGRVLREALAKPNGFKVPKGYYYLCDAGYANAEGFLTPYRGERYHLSEWRGAANAPKTARELYNKRHSSARNIIERAFGALKGSWAILRNKSHYPIEVQGDIIVGCCYLHNHLIREMGVGILDEFDNSDTLSTGSNDETPEVENIPSIEGSAEWTMFREMLAEQMFYAWEQTMTSSSANSHKHFWTLEEEDVLLSALMSLVNTQYHSPNGTFRAGYQIKVIEAMQKVLPQCRITKNSLECKVKTIKKHYMALKQMLGNGCSGFGWDESKQCVAVDRETFDAWVASHPAAKGLWNKPFPRLREMEVLFGADQAAGGLCRDPDSARSANAGKMHVGQGPTMDDVGLGSNDCYIPEQYATDYAHGSYMGDEMQSSPPTRYVGSGSQSRLSGEKRKQPEKKKSMGDVIRDMVAAHTNRMADTGNWQQIKEDIESTQRKAVMRKVKEMTSFTNSEKRIIAYEICKDPTNMKFFIDLEPEWVEDHGREVFNAHMTGK